MIMRARQDGRVLVFELEGHLDFETTLQFQDTCTALIKKHQVERVIFNFERLKFVGSSGINQFIQVLKQFNARPTNKPKLCHLSPEFVKVFRAYQASRHPFDIHESENLAIASFDAPPPPKRTAKRKKSGRA
jgi:anti-anti-sigma factor